MQKHQPHGAMRYLHAKQCNFAVSHTGRSSSAAGVFAFGSGCDEVRRARPTRTARASGMRVFRALSTCGACTRTVGISDAFRLEARARAADLSGAFRPETRVRVAGPVWAEILPAHRGVDAVSGGVLPALRAFREPWARGGSSWIGFPGIPGARCSA